MASPPVTLKLTGPLFDGQAKGLIQQAASGAVRELVKMGEERLNQQGRPRPGGVFLSVGEAGRNASIGNWRRNLHSVVRGLQGRIDDGGIVYGAWLEGVSSRNGRTRFRGYALFRKTQQWLDRRAQDVLRQHVKKLVRRLGG